VIASPWHGRLDSRKIGLPVAFKAYGIVWLYTSKGLFTFREPEIDMFVESDSSRAVQNNERYMWVRFLDSSMIIQLSK